MGDSGFDVRVTRLGPAVVVAPRGELDIATCPEVRAALEAYPSPAVVLDLREVEFMDTSGIHLIVELRHRVESFAVVRGQAVQRLLDIAGMVPYLNMVDTPEDAIGDVGHAAS
jgi:anti-anti-sigma factor